MFRNVVGQCQAGNRTSKHDKHTNGSSNIHLRLIIWNQGKPRVWHDEPCGMWWIGVNTGIGFLINSFIPDPASVVQDCSFAECSQNTLMNMFFLTHLPLVPHIWISKLCQHWFIQWLVAYSAPSHYLNHCWVIVNWIHLTCLHYMSLCHSINIHAKHIL